MFVCFDICLISSYVIVFIHYSYLILKDKVAFNFLFIIYTLYKNGITVENKIKKKKTNIREESLVLLKY